MKKVLRLFPAFLLLCGCFSAVSKLNVISNKNNICVASAGKELTEREPERSFSQTRSGDVEHPIYCNGEYFDNFYLAVQYANNASQGVISEFYLLRDQIIATHAAECFTFTHDIYFDLCGHTYRNTIDSVFVIQGCSFTLRSTGGVGTIASGGGDYGITVNSSGRFTSDNAVNFTSSTGGIYSEGDVQISNLSITSVNAAFHFDSDAINSTYIHNCNFSSNSTTIIHNGHSLIIDNTALAHDDSSCYDIALYRTDSNLNLYGNCTISNIYVEPGLFSSYGCRVSLAYDFNEYTGTPFSIVVGSVEVTEGYFSAGMNIFTAHSISSAQKVTILNSLPSYLTFSLVHYSDSYYGDLYYYKVENRTFDVTVNVTGLADASSCTLSKSTNVTHDDTVTATFNYGTSSAIQILSENCSVTNAEMSISYTTQKTTITLTNIIGNVALNVEVTGVPYPVRYDGNGATARIHTGEGYAPEGTIYVPFRSAHQVLLNPFEKEGYEFVCWCDKSDGTGCKYNEGSNFYNVFGSYTFYAIWRPTAASILDSFITDYLHMNDYNSNEGRCAGTDGYYATAKHELLSYEEYVIEEFKTSASYSASRERYETWASFNNDSEYMYIDDYSHISNESISNLENIITSNETTITFIIMISAISTLTILFLIKKKRIK